MPSEHLAANLLHLCGADAHRVRRVLADANLSLDQSHWRDHPENLDALLFATLVMQIHGVHLMSALSDKITTLTTLTKTLSDDLATAQANAATPADLEALDQVATDLQAIITSLAPPAPEA